MSIIVVLDQGEDPIRLGGRGPDEAAAPLGPGEGASQKRQMAWRGALESASLAILQPLQI